MGPSIPVAPTGPDGPVIPVGPVGPDAPTGPVDPVLPDGPDAAVNANEAVPATARDALVTTIDADAHPTILGNPNGKYLIKIYSLA